MSEPSSVVETLKLARAKIEDPKHWTKGALARRSKRGGEEAVDSDQATVWCALGAIKAVDGPFEDNAIDLLCQAIVGGSVTGAKLADANISSFNDHPSTKHLDVIRKFDEAIVLAEGTQP